MDALAGRFAVHRLWEADDKDAFLSRVAHFEGRALPTPVV